MIPIKYSTLSKIDLVKICLQHIYLNFIQEVKNNSEISNYIKSFGNVKCVNGPIEHYLSFVEKVICTYSSVGEEAKLLGISIEIILLNDKINESNLLDK